MEYRDAIQAKIEAELLHAKGSPNSCLRDLTNDQLIGATMLWHNIFYDEAKERIEQALQTIQTTALPS